jgi:SAM-dependent methyltransferase
LVTNCKWKLDIEQQILSFLQSATLDKYSIHRKISTESIFTISKAINDLQQRGQIHVAKYRKDPRIGIAVPLYSVHPRSEKDNELYSGDLLEGLAPGRYAEYEFVLRNLISRDLKAKILDVGCSTSAFSSRISKFSRNRCEIVGIDIVNEIGSLGFPLILMDAMNIGFKNKTFDQVMCLSTMEHIGLDHEGVNAKHKDPNCGINEDALAMKEIWRVLKDKGTLILTVPYGRLIIKQQGYRVYQKKSLSILTNMFFIVKKEFFGLKKGKWTRCNELEANNSILLEYSSQKFHSDIIACLLLEKR